MITMPPTTYRGKAFLNLILTLGLIEEELRMSHERVALELTLFTFGPPAPELLEKVNKSSSSGIVIISTHKGFSREVR